MKTVCMLAVGVAGTFLFADTCVWKGGSEGGWAEAGNWEGSKPDSSDDVVQVPEGTDLTVGDSDVSIAGMVSAVQLLGDDSRIVFDLEESDCTFNGSITGNGVIVKNGAKTLQFTSEEKDAYYVKGGMQVNAGYLKCPNTFSGTYSSETMSIGPLYVAKDAWFYAYAKYRTTVLSALSGEGTVFNGTSGGQWPLRIVSADLSSFSGRIRGHLRLQINAPVDLLGKNSNFTGAFSIYNTDGDAGVQFFGTGAAAESSIGDAKNNRDIVFSSSGRIRYLGTGETTDRGIIFSGGPISCIMDAGANGGLVLDGTVSSESDQQKVFVLSGSNSTVSVLRGGWSDYGTNSVYLAKTGTGTWFIPGHSGRVNRGVVGVEEGCLQFDTLAETNVPCSFGLSTRLAEKYTGDWDESRCAEYAILLGSPDTEGEIEFVGTNLWDNATASRPVAVTGKGGRIVADGPDLRIGFKGAFAADSAGATLTLDGANSTNYLYDVSDGAGKMSIAKDGTGTWVLAGDQTFSGSLSVNAGELVVSSSLGRKYSWYRFTVKGNQGAYEDGVAVESTTYAQFNELAFYDSEGNRVNKGLSVIPNRTIPGPGEVTFWQTGDPANSSADNGLDKLFDDIGTSAVKPFCSHLPGTAVYREKPETWLPIVMRVADANASATAYDILSQNSSMAYERELYSWTVEASADGVFWDVVDDVIGNTNSVSAYRRWYSDDTALVANAVRKGKGFAFALDNGRSLLDGDPDQLSAVSSVSVAPGAVLRAEGDVTLSALSVDASGAGLIDGFSVAADGVLDITSFGDIDGAVVLPVAFSGISGVDNFSSWSVNVNGEGSHLLLKYQSGKLVVRPRGLRMIVR